MRRLLPALLLLSACGGDTANRQEDVRPSEPRPDPIDGSVVESETHDISPTISCDRNGVTIRNFPRYGDGRFESFNLNVMRSDKLWGGLRFPDDLKRYEAAHNARENRFTLSWEQLSANVDATNEKAAKGVGGFYVFLSRSDFTHAEDMDNFSSCRSPSY